MTGWLIEFVGPLLLAPLVYAFIRDVPSPTDPSE